MNRRTIYAGLVIAMLEIPLEPIIHYAIPVMDNLYFKKIKEHILN
ncbi:MAG TPA: hypothetical protein VJJ21_02475 [Candidatus Nanoarchaeia archaeon]|nr:hypothetical protein [Candidatus Nanoarchaeia archaeon]